MSTLSIQKCLALIIFLTSLLLSPASAEAPRSILQANKPVFAVTRLEKSWQGFPAVLVHKAKMDLYFRNGNTVRCSNWDPTRLSPTPASVGRRIKGCKVYRGQPQGKRLQWFKRGATIDVAFGNIGAVGNNWIASSSSRISGSNLRMTKGGWIAIGKFRTTNLSSGGNGAFARSRLKSIKGRYFLDGHTITIRSNRGEMYYGFIGAQSNTGSNRVDHLYINGTHFWNRRK